MIYAIIIVFLLLFGLVAMAFARERRLGTVTNNDLTVKELAVSLRSPEAVGVSPRVNSVKRKLRRGYAAIVSKVKAGEELYEYEKWVYENYFSMLNVLKKRDYRHISSLPHKHNRARVEILADYIADKLKGDITPEEIRTVIEEFNSYTTLHIDEIIALKQAIKFALIKDIAEIASRSNEFRRDKRKALKDESLPAYGSRSICYLYWYKMSGKKISAAELSRTDINVENIEYDFSAYLIESGARVRASVLSMKALDKIFVKRFEIELSDTHNLLMNDAVYSVTDERAQLDFLRVIENFSIAWDVSERAIVEAIQSLERKSGEYALNFLFKRRVLKGELNGKAFGTVRATELRKFQWLYIAALYGFNTALSVLLGLITMSVPIGISVGVLSFFALIKTSERLIQTAHRYIMEKRPIPMLNSEALDERNRVLVTVPVYITSEKELNSAIEHIKALHAGNSGKNVYFALLVDYKKSDLPISDEETEWNGKLDYAFSELPDITCFIRRKEKIGNTYAGKERKRGAIEAMNEMLLSGDTSAFSHISRVIPAPEYVITLDADSKLLPNAVLRAVNTISHPLNNRYDLMAFNNAYDMNSMSSYYSLKYYYASGYENYGAPNDYYYDFLARGVYCGKGIYRLTTFHSKLTGLLPENRVLSHDIIEGAVLNTGALSESVYEDIPESIGTESARRARWLRGDIQLLEFVFRRKFNKNGVKTKIDKEPIYNVIMLNNALKAIGEIAAFALLLIALFMPSIVNFLPIIIASLLAPATEIGATVLHGHKSMRLRYVLSAVLSRIIDTVFYVLLLPFYAVNNLITIIRAAYSLAMKKGLNWKTYSMVKGAGTAAGYFAMIMPALVIILIIAAIGYASVPVTSAMGVMAAALIGLYAVNITVSRDKKITEYYKDELLSIARRTYGYFRSLNDNGLIPDNYQLKPFIGESANTSPTNIGMSLIAEISACELGIIEICQAHERITAILNKCAELEKYKGNLYNWYDVKSGEAVSPRYISSVDSGNFLASLIVTKEFLKAHGLSGAEIAERLIDETDLTVLYDDQGRLFHIGYNTENGRYDNNYDLFASEARILYYISAALNRNTSAWNNLRRDTVGNYYNVLMSWSGTAFEYLMPNIFMKGSKYGLIERSNQGLVAANIHNKCNGLWGISESGYYKFDEAMRYQYHAFGLSFLAKRVEEDRCIIAPYASMLALDYAPNKAVENLRLIRERGGMGDMGYFEAIDYTASEKFVMSYMAHHQGMALASAANYLCDSVIRKYFMSDVRMRSASILLTERNNRGKAYKKGKADFKYDEVKQGEYRYAVKEGIRHASVMSNGQYSVIIDSDGNSIEKIGRLDIGRKHERRYYGLIAEFDNGEKRESPLPALGLNTDIRVEYGVNECSFIGENSMMRVYVPHCFNGELREFEYFNRLERAEEIKCRIYLDIALAPEEDYLSHACFSDMFVSSEKLEEENAVIYRRKPRDMSEELYAGFVIRGAKCELTSNRYNALGRNGDFLSPQPSLKKQDFGDVLYPCFAANVELSARPHESAKFTLLIVAGKSREEVIEKIRLSDEPHFNEFVKESARVKSLSLAEKLKLSPVELQSAGNIAGRALYAKYRSGGNPNDIYKYGLDAAAPTFLAVYENNYDTISSIMRQCAYLTSGGLVMNLIVLCKSDVYMGNRKLELEALIGERIKLISDIDEAAIKDCVTGIFGSEFIKPIDVLRPEKTVQIDDKANFCSKNSRNMAISGAIDMESGSGGYIDNKFFVLNKPLLPYSHILSGRFGGTIVTENGGGFSFGVNSRENKITDWKNDPIADNPSERIYLIADGKAFRINRVINGCAEYGDTVKFYNSAAGFEILVEKFIIDEGKAIGYKIELENKRGTRDVDIIFESDMTLGAINRGNYLRYQMCDRYLKAENTLSGQSVYFTALDTFYPVKTVKRGILLGISAGTEGIRIGKRVDSGDKISEFIVISPYREVLDNLRGGNIEKLIEEEKARLAELNKFNLKSSEKSLDKLFNNLNYQIVESRIFARAGYYQAGGAVGFRDQLQDALTLMHTDPELAREIILNAAKRQFSEGDVLHWWHAPNKGVRTRISDDKLFLPYVVSKYIKIIGDKSILQEELPYLIGEPLSEGRESEYRDYAVSELSESLLMHCKRAIRNSLRQGEHGLLLIGSGDWNDALNAIGIGGRGESVWLTMFARMTIAEFTELLKSGERLGYLKVIDKLDTAIRAAYNGAWYKRAFTDSGEWLGDADSPYCRIDLISQAFAVLSGAVDNKTPAIAMENAAGKLVDYEQGIIKLLDPPFSSAAYYGYISSYPKGVRENGGQYTHAAVWYLIALCRLKKYDKAFELFKMINPAEKCRTNEGNAMYMGEPYVLAGDVYTNGQMGWSWYTGSASWAFILILEEFLGVTKSGEWLTVKPPRIKGFEDIELTYYYYATPYKLKFIRSNKRGVEINGVNYPDGTVKLINDGKERNITVYY